MRIILPTIHVRRSAQAIPLAAGNLKACLPEPFRGDTLLLDLFPENGCTAAVEKIMAPAPQLVAFPLYLWNRLQALEICRELRRRKPDLILLAGGPEASADGRQVLLEGELDGVILGEGEAVFAKLLRELDSGKIPPSSDGFLSRHGTGQEAIPAASCSDLSCLPSPWLGGELSLQPGCGVLWEVARGCRFDCAFCYDAKGHQGVRPLPEERLRKELQLFRKVGVDQVWVLDSTFNAPAERGKQLLRMLLKEAPQVHYHLEAKADFLDAETAQLLGQLSCSVQIGLQSARDDVLRPLHRSIQPEKMADQLRLLTEAGVTFGLDLIYGLPEDNHRGFAASLDFAMAQQPNQLDIFPLAVLPGTALHDQQQRYGLSAAPHPPYLIRSNRSYPPEQMAQSQRLAAASDIFYNQGRAVGFFLQLCVALGQKPGELLEEFANWFCHRPGLEEAALLSPEPRQPSQILALQLEFTARQLTNRGLSRLVPLGEDLIRYHFLCAETLLDEDCLPARRLPAYRQLWKTVWHLNPVVRIQRFHHDLTELEIRGGEPWKQLARQLRQESTYGIFLRREGEPMSEVLEQGFARQLLSADGQTCNEQLFRGVPRREAEELLGFAVAEGLLLPVT